MEQLISSGRWIGVPRRTTECADHKAKHAGQVVLRSGTHRGCVRVYHLIQKPEERFSELGGDFFLKKNKEQEERRAVRMLESLGFQVALTPLPA